MKTVVLSALGEEERAVEVTSRLEGLLREREDEVQWLELSGADVGPCLACSRCAKTGECVLRDEMTEILLEIAECDRLVLATPIVFGVHHPLLKKAVDRFLPLAGERFTIRRGEMHHRPRFPKRFSLLGVGSLGAGAAPGEAETFERLIDRHAVNIDCPRHAAVVLWEGEDAEGALREGIERTKGQR